MVGMQIKNAIKQFNKQILRTTEMNILRTSTEKKADDRVMNREIRMQCEIADTTKFIKGRKK